MTIPLTLRSVIGRRLTNQEVDNNFTALADAIGAPVPYLPLTGGTLTGSLVGTSISTTVGELGAGGAVGAVTGGLGILIGHSTAVRGDSTYCSILADNGGYGGYTDLILTARTAGAAAGAIRFYTGLGAPVERMRISSTGTVGIGRPTGDGATNSWVLNIGDGDSGAAGTNRTFIRIGRAADGSAAVDAYRAGIGAADMVLSAYGTERLRLVAGGVQTQAVAVGGNTIADAVNGSTWYGIGKTSSDLFGSGSTQVQVAGYSGVRIRSANAWLDIGMSAVGTNVLFTAQRFAAGWDSGVNGSVSCTDWFRSSGGSGWFNATYGGGIWMQDSTWVRTYGNKQFYCDNNILSAGNVTAYSDERLKTNWRDLPADFVEQLAEVKHGVYDRIDSGLTQVGVSAQSLQKVMPWAVTLGADDDMLSVSYGNAALAAAVAMAERVVALERRLAALEAA